MKKKLVCLVGKSGSGKNYIEDKIIEHFPDWHKVVTTTTRPMRKNESEGNPYHFESLADFLVHLNIPYYEMEYFNGWWYATPKESILYEKINIQIITPTGMKNLQKYSDELDINPWYIMTSDEMRFLRQSNREDKIEVERRKIADDRDFDQVDLSEYGIIQNDSDTELEGSLRDFYHSIGQWIELD